MERSGSGAGTAGSGAKQTLVEEGTTFKGSLASSCPVVVRGKIEGDVQAPSLNVSSSGSVHGTVKVADLRSAGELLGDFEADTVQLSGVVKDKTKLRAKSLEVRLSSTGAKMQVVFGDCTLDVGDPMTKEDAIRQAQQGDKPVEAPKPEQANAGSPSRAPEPRTSVRPSIPSQAPSKPNLDAKGEKDADANGASVPAPAAESAKSAPSKST